MIDEQAKRLKLWVRRKKAGLKLICSGCGQHVPASGDPGDLRAGSSGSALLCRRRDIPGQEGKVPDRGVQSGDRGALMVWQGTEEGNAG